MQKGKKGNQIVLALVITAVSLAIYKIVPRLFFAGLQDSFQKGFLAEVVFAVPIFILILIIGRAQIYRPNPKMLRKGWKAACIMYIMIVLAAMKALGTNVNIGGIDVLYFLMQMFLIGYCEEVLFRGLILNAFHDCFGKRSLGGTRLAVVCSGIIFGAAHLLNAFNPGVNFSSAAVQAGGALFMGICFGAIYIRTGKALWYMIFLHAVYDGIAFISSGRMDGNTEANIIGQYANGNGLAIVGIMALIYGGVALFLLRKKKLEPCIAELDRTGR